MPHVFRLMYRSRSTLPQENRPAELGALFTQARANNKAKQLSGALLLTDEWFVQILEGDEATVRALFARIELDPRHDSVTLLDAGTVDERAFSRWAMARVSVDGEPDIPLIASQHRGVAAGAGWRTTSDQDGLLARMREAAQPGSPVR